MRKLEATLAGVINLKRQPDALPHNAIAVQKMVRKRKTEAGRAMHALREQMVERYLKSSSR